MYKYLVLLSADVLSSWPLPLLCYRPKAWLKTFISNILSTRASPSDVWLQWLMRMAQTPLPIPPAAASYILPRAYVSALTLICGLKVRLAAIAAAVAVAARSTGLLAPQAVAFVHMLAYGIWMGTNVWTTFFAGITMFKNLPRQTFGRLQVRF